MEDEKRKTDKQNLLKHPKCPLAVPNKHRENSSKLSPGMETYFGAIQSEKIIGDNRLNRIRKDKFK